jgi:dolichyl-phosphate beta-glucosyltransferase
MDGNSTLSHRSCVTPAYEAQRIGHTLRAVGAYLQRQPFPAEIIVVDDGSRDATAATVAAFEAALPPVRLLRHGRNRGKGFSVRQGFVHASGDYLLFSDVDLSTPIEEVEKLLAALREPCEVAIGSRALAASQVEVRQPRYREYMGRLYNRCVQALAVPGIQDTQCGFKCFRRDAALAICARMTAEGFGFDVEMLYLARHLGYRVREVPVVWRHAPQSRVRLWQDPVSMLGELVRIRWRDLWGRYDRPQA